MIPRVQILHRRTGKETIPRLSIVVREQYPRDRQHEDGSSDSAAQPSDARGLAAQRVDRCKTLGLSGRVRWAVEDGSARRLNMRQLTVVHRPMFSAYLAAHGSMINGNALS